MRRVNRLSCRSRTDYNKDQSIEMDAAAEEKNRNRELALLNAPQFWHEGG